jgi:hypothetical protein
MSIKNARRSSDWADLVSELLPHTKRFWNELGDENKSISFPTKESKPRPTSICGKIYQNKCTCQGNCVVEFHGYSLDDDALLAIASHLRQPRWETIDAAELQKYAALGVNKWTEAAMKASEREDIREMPKHKKASLRHMAMDAAPILYPRLGKLEDGHSLVPPVRVVYDNNFRFHSLNGHPEQHKLYEKLTKKQVTLFLDQGERVQIHGLTDNPALNGATGIA